MTFCAASVQYYLHQDRESSLCSLSVFWRRSCAFKHKEPTYEGELRRNRGRVDVLIGTGDGRGHPKKQVTCRNEVMRVLPWDMHGNLAKEKTRRGECDEAEVHGLDVVSTFCCIDCSI